MSRVLVRRDEDLEAGLLGGSQQLAVRQSVSVFLHGRAYRVADQKLTNRDRRGLIEQDPHSARHWRVEAARGKFDDRLHLVAVQSVIPRKDVVDIRAGFEVLEDRRDRHAGVAKHPRSADFAGDALDRWALGPIEQSHRFRSFRV